MKEKLIIVITFLLVILGHGVNMLNYPYFENDEGTYMAQAYAVGYQGKVTNYTYWYDHSPLGWMITSVWLKATGGPFAFGYSLNSARIFMLFVHIMSAIVMYLIVKKLTDKTLLASLSVIIFTISPIAVYFNRRLLLDNIMTFFMLLSIVLLLYSKRRLSMVVLAGMAYAAACLSKETAAVTLPGYLLLTAAVIRPKQRIIGVVSYVLPVVLAGSFFVLFAALRNELFPGPGHVSLIGSWAYQLSRGSKLPFWNPSSDFQFTLHDWFNRDWIFMTLFIIANFWTMIKKQKDQIIRAISIIIACLMIFFMRGGLILNFYVGPLVAIGSILIGLMIKDLIQIKKNGIVILSLILFIWLLLIPKKAWVIDETSPQRDSVEWIKKNIDSNAVLAIDNSQLLDLQLSRFPGDPAIPKAHWFWKLDQDPEIVDGVIQRDWRKINYIVLTHEFLIRVRDKDLPFVKNALDYSTPLVTWGPISKETYLHVPRRISTNGDWVHIYRVMDDTDIVLQQAWISYREKFVTYEGQVIDPQSDSTTSEGQAYGLLRSLMSSDRDTFDLILAWTRSHLQYRNEDKLFSWKWAPAKNGIVVDPGFATDADIDIATALIMASRKWNDPKYLDTAKPIVNDIWRQSVVRLTNGKYYILPGVWGGYGDVLTINPSYISPASFRVFAQIDPIHRWEQLAIDSYQLLNDIRSQSSTGLIPDWVGVVRQNGAITTAPKTELSHDFSYDAIRVYWRIALDASWFNTNESKEFLVASTFLSDYYNSKSSIPAGFSLDGNPVADYESNAFYGALLPYMKITSPSAYQNMAGKLHTSFVNGSWREADNYYTQNWAWFGIALSENKFIYEKP